MHSNSSAHNDALLLIILLSTLNWYPLLLGHMPKSITSNQFIPLMMCTLFWKSYTKDKLENNTNIPISIRLFPQSTWRAYSFSKNYILYLICIIRSYFNVTSPGHYIAMKARSKLFIDQGRITLYRLFWYIGKNMFNVCLHR